MIKYIYFTVSAHQNLDTVALITFKKMPRSTNQKKEGQKIMQKNQDIKPIEDPKTGIVHHEKYSLFCKFMNLPKIKLQKPRDRKLLFL